MIVGISGRSCSGKTRIAKAMSLALDFKVLHLDDYFIPGSKNWEAPEAYNFLELVKEIEKHNGDLIVEGFLLFTNEEALKTFDKKVYLDIPDDTLLKRRKTRKDVPHSSDYILETVIPQSKIYEEAQREVADIVVSGEDSQDGILKEVLELLR